MTKIRGSTGRSITRGGGGEIRVTTTLGDAGWVGELLCSDPPPHPPTGKGDGSEIPRVGFLSGIPFV
jgi:hypothetical protein